MGKVLGKFWIDEESKSDNFPRTEMIFVRPLWNLHSDHGPYTGTADSKSSDLGHSDCEWSRFEGWVQLTVVFKFAECELKGRKLRCIKLGCVHESFGVLRGAQLAQRNFDLLHRTSPTLEWVAPSDTIPARVIPCNELAVQFSSICVDKDMGGIN